MAIRSARPALLAVLAAASTLAALPAAADRPGPGRGGFGGAPRVQPYRAPGPQFHAPGPAVRIHAPGPAVRFHGPGAGPGYWYHGHHDGIWGWWWVAGASWLFYPQPVVVQPAPSEPIVVQPAPQTNTENWYYCDSAQAYYPYAQSCPEGWRQIPATPPGNTRNNSAGQQSWYYCDSARGYYPYVPSCPEGWRAVAATPPEGTQPSGDRQP